MSSRRPHLDWIDTQYHAMCRRVTDWSNINSSSSNLAGLGRMSSVLREAFSALGGEASEVVLPATSAIDDRGQVVYAETGKAVSVVKRPDAPLRVFLCIHMDTVYPADHPFQATTLLDTNTLRGPGVADAKGGLAVMLTALEAFERSPEAARLGWDVLINPDEEIGSVGSSRLLTDAAQRQPPRPALRARACPAAASSTGARGRGFSPSSFAGTPPTPAVIFPSAATRSWRPPSWRSNSTP